jgi:hypothetical protein
MLKYKDLDKRLYIFEEEKKEIAKRQEEVVKALNMLTKSHLDAIKRHYAFDESLLKGLTDMPVKVPPSLSPRPSFPPSLHEHKIPPSSINSSPDHPQY